MSSPILKGPAPVGAVVPKQLPLHATEAIRDSSEEGDVCPFPLGKGASTTVGLLKSSSDILMAQT